MEGGQWAWDASSRQSHVRPRGEKPGKTSSLGDSLGSPLVEPGSPMLRSLLLTHGAERDPGRMGTAACKGLARQEGTGVWQSNAVPSSWHHITSPPWGRRRTSVLKPSACFGPTATRASPHGHPKASGLRDMLTQAAGPAPKTAQVRCPGAPGASSCSADPAAGDASAPHLCNMDRARGW